MGADDPADAGHRSGLAGRNAGTFVEQKHAASWRDVSPDGRWLAYTSNESGRAEVFVRSFPGPGGRWQVSTTGGRVPTWSPRRHELFYLSPDSHLMVASYTVEGHMFRADAPQKWSEQTIN